MAKDAIEQVVEDFNACFRFGGYTEQTMGQLASKNYGCNEKKC